MRQFLVESIQMFNRNLKFNMKWILECLSEVRTSHCRPEGRGMCERCVYWSILTRGGARQCQHHQRGQQGSHLVADSGGSHGRPASLWLWLRWWWWGHVRGSGDTLWLAASPGSLSLSCRDLPTSPRSSQRTYPQCPASNYTLLPQHSLTDNIGLSVIPDLSVCLTLSVSVCWWQYRWLCGEEGECEVWGFLSPLRTVLYWTVLCCTVPPSSQPTNPCSIATLTQPNWRGGERLRYLVRFLNCRTLLLLLFF